MSFSELRCFHAVAQTGSFSKAAEMLLRAQPTITIQVAQLEKRYGTELFHRRRGQKIKITNFGQRLYEITTRLFALEVDALELLGNGESLRTGHIRIGASSPNLATQYILPFRKRYPGVEVSLSLGNSAGVINDVRDCIVDVGFLGGDGNYPGCDIQTLARPEIVLVAQKDHPAVQNGYIPLADIVNQTILLREPGSQTRELFLKRLENEGVRPGETIEIGSREGVCAAAGAGLGFAIIALDEIQQGYGIETLRIEEFEIFGAVHAISLKERGYTELIRAFREVVDGVAQGDFSHP